MPFGKLELHDTNAPVDYAVGRILYPLTEQEEQMDKHKRSAWWFYLGLLGIFLLGFGLIFVNHHYEATNKLIVGIFEPLGHAFIIAAILGVTVDLFVKVRLLREASNDIAKYLIGYKLPEEIQDRIKEIMGATLIRKDVIIHYKMTQSPQNPDKLLVEVKYEHQIENLTNSTIDYPDQIDFPVHENPTVVEMRCDSNDKGASYCHDNVQGDTSIKSIIRFSGDSVPIKPKSKNSNVRYRFTIRYSYEKFKNDSDYFAIMMPSIGFALTAEYPDTIEFVGPYHWINKDRWEDDRAFVRGEHISFRWFEKEPTLIELEK
jgi:hypothetical protein